MRLLYIDIDTLRPDHLGCYGYHRDTSPNIDALAADGVRWREACLADSPTGVDPLDTVLDEGGPWHGRGHLLEYAERLRATGRGGWADELLARHPREAAGAVERGGF